jgi:predicted ester cyclase
VAGSRVLPHPFHVGGGVDECTGVAKGEFMSTPGNGRRVTFRILHVWDFKDGAISREQVWVDGGSIAAQLTAQE